MHQGGLAEVAGAILDGAPIDWEAAESGVDNADRALLDRLRVVAALADVHRRGSSLPDAASAERPALAHAPHFERWGHLRVLERIGRGAFGEVHRAWDTRLDREVALKVIPAAAAAGTQSATTIIEEGRLLARVRHQNVVTIYGADRIGDQIGLWMEFVKGVTLAQTIEQGKTFGVHEALDIGTQLCSAVAAVHSAGLLHRDIKAQNVMRAEDGRIVLMDFGTGRELGDAAASGLAGTPLYLAPELLSGAGPSVRSDVYSVGVLLYHLFTGVFPVRARNVRELREAHARGDRASLRAARPDLPAKLIDVIERAIDPRPERRHANAAALGNDLAALTRRPRRVVSAAMLAVGGVIAAVWMATAFRHGDVRSAIGGGVGTSRAALDPMERPVIAVLPFRNLSAEPDSDYFVDGLTDEIIRNLAVVKGLEVRSHTSSFAFKDRRDLPEVARRLDVNLIVEGSVLRAGNRLRVNAQLVRVAGDVPMWSDAFDRELQDVFAIQDEISRAIVNQLRLTLGAGQRRYDTNIETYELYLKGRALLDRRDLGQDAAKAAALFKQVIDKDPAFAPAHAGLTNAYVAMSHNLNELRFSSTDAQPLMRDAAVKALQLDPLLPEAHAAMGWVYTREYDWPNAEKSFQRAIDLNPSLTHLYTDYVSWTLLVLGKLQEADRLLNIARSADPLSLDVQRALGVVAFMAGRYEEAIETLQRVRAADPRFPFVEMWLARALTFGGRPAEALALYAEGNRRNSQWQAHAYVMTGRRQEAERLADINANHPFRIATIAAALGDRDRSFAALQKVESVEPHRIGMLMSFPELAGLRDDPRFAALRRRFNLPSK